MTEKLKKCPFCNRELVRTTNTYKNSQGKEVMEDFYSHNVTAYPEYCPAEEIVIGNNVKDITAWNARAADENPVLTLDELRGMEGEPVWCVDNKGNVFCMLVDSENNLCVDIECNFWEFPGYGITDDFNELRQGSWLAYRRKPEVKG